MHPKFDLTGVQTHDLWIMREYFTPLRRFRTHNHEWLFISLFNSLFTFTGTGTRTRTISKCSNFSTYHWVGHDGVHIIIEMMCLKVVAVHQMSVVILVVHVHENILKQTPHTSLANTLLTLTVLGHDN